MGLKAATICLHVPDHLCAMEMITEKLDVVKQSWRASPNCQAQTGEESSPRRHNSPSEKKKKGPLLRALGIWGPDPDFHSSLCSGQQLSDGRCYADRDSDSSWVDMENHSGIVLHRLPASSLTPLSPLTTLNSACTLTAVLFYFHWLWITFQFRIKEQWVGGSTVLRLKACALGKKKNNRSGLGPLIYPLYLGHFKSEPYFLLASVSLSLK